MIKYSLFRNEINHPKMKIEDKYWMLWEIGSCSHEFIKQKLQELEEVKRWEREYCTGIGYEMIDITWYWPNDKEYPNSALIEYDYCEKSMVVPFDDIYNLMKDLKNYIEVWERETGLEKNWL